MSGSLFSFLVRLWFLQFRTKGDGVSAGISEGKGFNILDYEEIANETDCLACSSCGHPHARGRKCRKGHPSLPLTHTAMMAASSRVMARETVGAITANCGFAAQMAWAVFRYRELRSGSRSGRGIRIPEFPGPRVPPCPSCDECHELRGVTHDTDAPPDLRPHASQRVDMVQSE